ncbi:MAG: ATP-dependent DNA helicase RecG [Clostridia bacterium]|nr:ATP-dependent DNA helicase RecG [Clostridia bacterium]
MARISLSDSPIVLSGVGKTRIGQLNKLGIFTVGDLIRYFPRAYEKRSDVRLLSSADPNFARAYILTVATKVSSAKIKSGLTITKFRAFDDSGYCDVVFFNSPYVKEIFNVGDTFRFYGKAQQNKRGVSLTNPKYERYDESTGLSDFAPIYHLTSGLSSKILAKLIKEAINDAAEEIIDPLPEAIRYKLELPTLNTAIKSLHFPEVEGEVSRSIRRLAFDEMLYFALGISMSKNERVISEGVKFSPCKLDKLTALLPYELTGSQKAAINDIYKDTVLKRENGSVGRMARIIVGDVGSGKTICALAAVYISFCSGYQSALMVPTEILARQHYEDAKKLLGALGVKVELLLGSTSAKEKRRIYEGISTGEIDLVIGTHALITDKVDFRSLGLIITDEQHRFGVNQRAVLKERNERAHMLVMSATPIPRTLALAMYGDLDVSRITEMPKGRKAIDTFVVDSTYRERMNGFIRAQVNDGGQCYVVCPSIEPEEEVDELYLPGLMSEGALYSEKQLNLKNVVEYTEELRQALPDISIDLLHGKMNAGAKDEAISKFASGDTRVLVSTTVIEVGVNVPNASVMIVENAERFGLSQLHQLRGRVGRGERKSYCILVSDLKSERSRERLETMRTTLDGFEIAEKDLLQRGPGDFFSSVSSDNLRQSGGFDFYFAQMCDDKSLFDNAFSIAKSLLEADPKLSQPENIMLREELFKMTKINSSTIS